MLAAVPRATTASPVEGPPGCVEYSSITLSWRPMTVRCTKSPSPAKRSLCRRFRSKVRFATCVTNRSKAVLPRLTLDASAMEVAKRTCVMSPVSSHRSAHEKKQSRDSTPSAPCSAVMASTILARAERGR